MTAGAGPDRRSRGRPVRTCDLRRRLGGRRSGRLHACYGSAIVVDRLADRWVLVCVDPTHTISQRPRSSPVFDHLISRTSWTPTPAGSACETFGTVRRRAEPREIRPMLWLIAELSQVDQIGLCRTRAHEPSSHRADQPPSEAIVWPVIQFASSLRSQATRRAVSTGVLQRPPGLSRITSARVLSLA
jgi:hypothetical protein